MQEAILRMDLSTPEKRAASAERMKVAQAARRAEGEAAARALGLPVTSPDGSAWITGVTPDGLPEWTEIQNVNAAISTNLTAAVARPVYAGLTGSGMLVGEWDADRARQTHQEFEGRLTLKEAGSASADAHFHSTHVAGTLIAAGINPAVRGMAPDANLWFWSGADDLAEMTPVAALSAGEGMDGAHLLMSNHSYGQRVGWHFNSGTQQWVYWGAANTTEDAAFGRYNIQSQAMDALCRQALYYLPFHAAGNDRNNGPAQGDPVLLIYTGGGPGTSKNYNPVTDPKPDWQNGGYDTLGPDKGFKNAMDVGAVDDAVTNGVRNPAAGTPAVFTSWGPTDDGRIKPDLVANGVSLLSSWHTGDQDTSAIGGTSMASPSACGSALILQQYYKQRFNTVMMACHLKALLLHTADDLGNPGPDYQNGWGLMNTEAALDAIRAAADHPGTPVMKTSFLANSWKDEWTTVVTYTGSTGPLKVTICWTDPAGTPVANNNLNDRTRMLVNDLDLEVTNSSGHVIYRPWVLDWLNPATPATKGDNVVDNVEQVVATPAPGLYTVRVSHKGSVSGGPQPFAVIISGHQLNAGDPPSLQVTGGNFSTTTFQGNKGQPGHLAVKNAGGGSLSWSAASNQTWLVPTPASGTGTGEDDIVVLNLNTQSLAPGDYTANVTVTAADASGPLTQTRLVYVTVLPSLPVATALDSVPGTVSFAGTGAVWLGQADVSQNGDAARSGAVLSGQESILQFSGVPQGKLVIGRTLSGAVGDAFEIRVDNVVKSTITGNQPWADGTTDITGAGLHTVSLVHRKSSAAPLPTDGAWVDNLRFYAAPVITNPGKLYTVQSQPFSFQIEASGNPVSYSVTGLNTVPGLTVNSSSGEISGTPTVSGSFNLTLNASNAFAGASQAVTLRVLPQPWVDVGADYPQTDSDPASPRPWFTQTAITHDSVDAIQSGNISHGAETAAWMKVDGPGVVNFYWRVSSEAIYDKLILQLDGVDQDAISGEVAWVRKTVNIPAGEHEVRFIYRKDTSLSVGSDAAWVDEFSLLRAPQFTGPDVAGALLGQPFLYVIESLNNPAAYAVSALPPGLTLDSATGRITGTPTAQAITTATATISNGGGSASRTITFNVGRSISLANATDTTGITWETTGDGTWFGQAGISHDGVDAARSPVLGEGQIARMRFPTPGHGRVFFRYRTSTHSGDKLFATGAANNFAAWSGDSGPAFKEASLRVEYGGFMTFFLQKNADGITAGQDAVWVDQVRYIADPYPKGASLTGFTGQPFSYAPESLGGPFDTFSIDNLPPGLTTDAATRTLRGIPATAGTYPCSQSMTGPGGTNSGIGNLFITIGNSIALATGIDWSATLLYPVTTGGDTPWFGQTLEKADTVDAGRSGLITHHGRTWFQTTAPGGSLLQWKWKVSSEAGHDFLKLEVDGEEAATISGEQDWAARGYHLGAGTHTIRFVYAKDASVNAGSDAAWVDELTWLVPPSITSPGTVTGTVGTALTSTPSGLIPLGSTWTATGLPPGITILPASGVMSGTPTSAGVFNAAITATNEAGSGTRSVVFTIAQSSLPAVAADGTGLTWASERGQVSWFGQSLVTHDGVDALQSGFIPHAKSAGDELIPSQTTASVSLNGPGILAFWCRVDCEANYDFLTISVDDAVRVKLSGTVAWHRRQLELQPGPHRVRFVYSKDDSFSVGADAAWLDEVSFTPGPVPPPVRITAVRFSANGRDILLDFNSRTGRSYTIERSTNLTLWTSFGGTLAGNDGTLTFTHSNGVIGNPRWFYRVTETTP